MRATRERTNYRLPADVVKAAAKRAARDGVTVTDVVEAALRVFLDVYPSWAGPDVVAELALLKALRRFLARKGAPHAAR